MTLEQLTLQDGSLVQVSCLDSGMISIEHLRPMTLTDGHGFAVTGSVLLTEADIPAFLAWLMRAPAQEAVSP